ncbi:hypothetical protein FQN55_001348 [Onygenales sp. PD_40]|nr:hypothetical protein FQN55_001348 [Onygenales sp. PD_40]KAK2786052.1 hypothetical protein FQN52_008048 [Onygenales sp. PD_12]KAK2786645.1 hypothetical protein FQN53_006349 [Emmonsiellopsis sp. PD_33]
MESAPSSTSGPAIRLPPAQIDCKWWKQGNCRRGSECFFRHDEALAGVDSPAGHPALETANVQNESADASASPGPGTAHSPTTASRNLENGEEQCAICLEKPAIFGLLVNCDHVFCLDCIKSWRASSAADAQPAGSSLDSRVPSKTTKTCPLCRVASDFVIPSSVFPTPPEPEETEDHATASEDSTVMPSEPTASVKVNPAKVKIIEAYLAKLKTTPCRYFEESVQRWRDLEPIANPDRTVGGVIHAKFSGACVFGNQCHFAHVNPITQAPYVFTPRELSMMKRENYARRARQLRRRLRVTESREEWNDILSSVHDENPYTNGSLSDEPRVAYEHRHAMLTDPTAVFYDIILETVAIEMEDFDD